METGTGARALERRGRWLALGASLGVALGLTASSPAQSPAWEGRSTPSTLRGQIVDRSGRLMVEDWRVEVFETSEDPRTGRWPTRSYAAPDPASGLFAHESSGRGPLLLRARHASGLESALVEVDASETFVTLSYAGPHPERTIVLHARAADEVGGAPALDPGRAFAARGRSEPVAFRALDCAWMTLDDAWIATDLEPGSYDVEYRDPRFGRGTALRVATGASAGLTLRGSAALHVVVESADGRPIPHALVVGRTDDRSRRVVQSPGDPVGPEPMAVEGLFPGRHALTVLTPGWPGVVAYADLAPGDSKSVTIRLEPPRRVRGRALDADGSPVPNATVSAWARLSSDEWRLRQFIAMSPLPAFTTDTDLDGSFSLALPESAPLTFGLEVSDRDGTPRRFRSQPGAELQGSLPLRPMAVDGSSQVARPWSLEWIEARRSAAHDDR